MGKKAEYLDNRDLALRIVGGHFRDVFAEVGERLTPVRAARIVDLMRDEYHIRSIDKGLLELAARKRPGHKGGPVTPPGEGEEREYLVGTNGRIGVPLGILGKRTGDRARVKYSNRLITIR